MKQRLDAGAASYFEYQVAYANAQSAYQNYISAKYERAFRRLVLEFYLSPNVNTQAVAPERPSLDK